MNAKTITKKKYEALHKAFDSVKNKKDWKMPINKLISATPTQIRLIEESVIFFTGGCATVQRRAKGLYRITADGYYNSTVI